MKVAEELFPKTLLAIAEVTQNTETEDNHVRINLRFRLR